jgi:hypothetical protein
MYKKCKSLKSPSLSMVFSLGQCSKRKNRRVYPLSLNLGLKEKYLFFSCPFFP